jgi:hypothetical protein
VERLTPVVETDDHKAFHTIASHALFASSCLTAQEQAYHYAVRLYPNAATTIKETALLDLAWATIIRAS